MPETAAYQKPIEQLLKMSELTLTDTVKTARNLAVRSDIPPTTGYRVVEAMESRGYIERDLAGNFIRGKETLRVALSAWGVGALYLPCEPVLTQLNEESGFTAFFGVCVDNELFIGPVSPGSGADQAIPSINARLRFRVSESEGEMYDVSIAGLSDSVGQSGVARHAVFSGICKGIDNSHAVVGVLLTRPAGHNRASISNYVYAASQRMQDSLSESGS